MQPVQTFLPKAVVLPVVLAVLGILAAAPAPYAEAKCPDTSGAICSDLRFTLSPDQPTAGRETEVVARWVDERTDNPITNEEWLAPRGSPVYLWVWDHRPSPDERETHSVLAGTDPAPQYWVTLEWDGAAYRGSLTLSSAGQWYMRVDTTAPVPGFESDRGIGYSGTVYPHNVKPGSAEGLVGSLRNWPWLAAGPVVFMITLLSITLRVARYRTLASLR